MHRSAFPHKNRCLRRSSTGLLTCSLISRNCHMKPGLKNLDCGRSMRGETEQTLLKCSKGWSNCRLFHGIDSLKGPRILLHVDTLGNRWKIAVAVIVVFTSSLSEWSTAGTVCHKIDAATVNSFKNRLDEENVRWTSLKTECLQVLWLHESVGFMVNVWRSGWWYQVQPHPVRNSVRNGMLLQRNRA